MRRLLLTTAAASAMASTALAVPPPPEPPLVGGYIPGDINSGLYQDKSIAGSLEVGFYWTDDEKNQFRGEGRVNLPVGSTWNILLETGGTAYYFDDGFSESSIGANAHLWRGSGNLRWGVFAGVNFNEANYGKLGIEAEYDVTSRFTIGADLSYAFASPEDHDLSVLGLRVWSEFYLTANTKLSGEIAYYDFDLEYGSESLWAFQKKLTHRFEGSPLNVFVEVDYYRYDDDHTLALGGGVSVLLDGRGTQESFDKNHVPFDALGGPQIINVAVSDRRLKTDIVKVGMLTPDIPLYRFRYLWSDEVFVGVMAQDLLATRPNAVLVNNAGFYAVNYTALGTRMMRLEEWQASRRTRRQNLGETEPVAAALG